ncbi:hypothetical protein EIP91_009435 [Steccherinum ochraceum]|uniref:RRM domain-containing protein n=1 Tax=Steccherinum ochraceum TaxID=92696 RepID=A0A4R0RRJ9_9APHY|nr:hypothetical protein EIP91_009435 [Steccherinum ochraceum]
MSKHIARNVKKIFRHIGPERPQIGETPYVKVTGLPRTAVPRDLRRLCVKMGVENIAEVSVYYERFTPTREGYITFTHPSFVRDALRTLNNSVIGGQRVLLEPASEPTAVLPARTRGAKGRAEAAERGVILGDGPAAGVSHPGKTVLLTGLPYGTTVLGVRYLLQSYHLEDTLKLGQDDIIRIQPQHKDHVVSTFLIRLQDASSAQRLIRHFHMTPFQKSQERSAKFFMKARVIS